MAAWSFDMALSVRVLLAIAAVTGTVSAQHAGDSPPALVWDQMKGTCPAHLDWPNLRGKVVVISLSPGNALPGDIEAWKAFFQHSQSEDIQLIQVIGGSEFLLDQALQPGAYQGCVLFDPLAKNQRNFNLPPLYRTVVVDRFGFIAGYARGAAGGALRLNGLEATPPQLQHYDAAPELKEASVGVRISPAAAPDARCLGLTGPGTYVSKNQPLKAVILDLWDTPLARITLPDNLPVGNYNVTANLPGLSGETVLQQVRDTVQQHFGLVVTQESRSRRVYLLTVLSSQSPHLQPAAESEKWMRGGGEGSIAGTAQTMQALAEAFEGLLEVPVIDATGLLGKYNYSVRSNYSGPKSAFDLARQLGLELTPAERPIETLLVQIYKELK